MTISAKPALLAVLLVACEPDTESLRSGTPDVAVPRVDLPRRALTDEEKRRKLAPHYIDVPNTLRRPAEDPRYMSCWGTPLTDGGFEDVFCDYYSINNLHTFAEAFLYAEHVDERTGQRYRAPTGAESDCTPPYTAAKVPCWVHTTDAEWNKLEIVRLVCEGHETYATAEKCCKIVDREPAYEKFEGWPE